MSNSCVNRSGSIFDVPDSTLMYELRAEAFSEPILKQFIQYCLNDSERDLVLNSDDFLFVADSYHWLQLRTTMEHIVLACDQTPQFPISDLLVQTWRCLPSYLEKFGKFYQLGKVQNSPLMFMHKILTNKIGGITKQQLKLSVDLRDNYYLSLDTSMILKLSNPGEVFVFGQLVSRSKSKLRFAIITLHQILFSNIDIARIYEAIKSNKGSRYYNISTDSLVNTPTVKRMSNVSDKYQVVASKPDRDLFNHIISFIDNDDIRNPIPMPSFDISHKFPTRSPPKQTNRLRDNWDEVSDSYEDTSPLYSSDDDDDDDDDFYLPITSKKSSKDKSPPPALRRVQIEPIVETKKKRKNIPSKVRQMTWRKYIGNTMDGKCWCCDDKISIEKWHAGHVIPASKGGPDSVANLRPLCQGCNLSMSNKHMADFLRHHDMKGKGAQEFANDNYEEEENLDRILDQMASLAV